MRDGVRVAGARDEAGTEGEPWFATPHHMLAGSAAPCLSREVPTEVIVEVKCNWKGSAAPQDFLCDDWFDFVTVHTRCTVCLVKVRGDPPVSKTNATRQGEATDLRHSRKSASMLARPLSPEHTTLILSPVNRTRLP